MSYARDVNDKLATVARDSTPLVTRLRALVKQLNGTDIPEVKTLLGDSARQVDQAMVTALSQATVSLGTAARKLDLVRELAADPQSRY